MPENNELANGGFTWTFGTAGAMPPVNTNTFTGIDPLAGAIIEEDSDEDMDILQEFLEEDEMEHEEETADLTNEPIAEKVKYENKDFEVRLKKGGRAFASACIQTACGNWWKKDDPDITKDALNPKVYVWKDASIILVNNFDKEGLPVLNDTNNLLYTHERNINKLTTINWSVKATEDKFILATKYTLHELLPLDFYQECFLNANFYHINTKLPNRLKASRYRKVNAIKSTKTQTTIFDSVTGEYKTEPLNTQDLFKFGVKSPSYKKTEGKKYSFGVEIETIVGILPAYLDKDLNYEAVHDGSLKGPNGEEPLGAEYVTGVLTGDTGFLQLKRLCNELTRRCKVDKRCGVHVHMGGMNFNKANIVYLYKLLLILEKDIFNMLPPSRRNNEYCRTLKPINLNFVETDFNSTTEYDMLIENYHNKIMEFLSYTGLNPRVSKKFDHPLGHKCGYKHESARYCWANFIPAVFNTRKNGIYTFEFRPYSGTTSYEKIKYWILICMGIMWFVENHAKEIALNKDITLKYIIDKAYPKQGIKIINYIEKRMSKFKSDNPNNDSALQEQLDYEESVTDPSLSIKSI